MTTYGTIDIIMGCMFSGKSTELIRRVNRYKVLEKQMMIINHSLDNRYGENNIATHSNLKIDCICVSELESVKEKFKAAYENCHILIIEEAQFFKGLYKFVLEACEIHYKKVLVVGLDGDSNRNEFGEILKLIPVCNSVKKLYGLCVICNDGTDACFTKRLTQTKEQVCIGTNEFIAVCRKHFLQNM